jgi:hypothetical protein
MQRIQCQNFRRTDIIYLAQFLRNLLVPFRWKTQQVEQAGLSRHTVLYTTVLNSGLKVEGRVLHTCGELV